MDDRSCVLRKQKYTSYKIIEYSCSIKLVNLLSNNIPPCHLALEKSLVRKDLVPLIVNNFT